jgi:hypothetical protein
MEGKYQKNFRNKGAASPVEPPPRLSALQNIKQFSAGFPFQAAK